MNRWCVRIHGNVDQLVRYKVRLTVRTTKGTGKLVRHVEHGDCTLFTEVRAEGGVICSTLSLRLRTESNYVRLERELEESFFVGMPWSVAYTDRLTILSKRDGLLVILNSDVCYMIPQPLVFH